MTTPFVSSLSAAEYALCVLDSVEDVWEEGIEGMTAERAEAIALDRLGPCGDPVFYVCG